MALLLWKGVLPAWRVLNTDFPNYYLVARLFREGYGLDRVYDWIWLQRIKDHWGLSQSLVGFAGLTPLSALPIVPLSVFSALMAKRIWIVVNLGFLAASAELLHRSTSLGRRRVWLISLLAVLPLRTSFLYGQMHLFVLLLMVLAYFFHQRRREVACGVCIALAGALKVYPLLFVLYFLWKRRWRTALATLSAAAVIVLAGGSLMGWDVQRIYALQILPRSLQGETLDPYNLHAASGAAFFHRLFLFEPALNPSPAFASPTAYAIVYPLWQMAILVPLLALLRASSSSRREQVEWAAFLFSLLLLSPVPSSYHFVVMILPAALFLDSLAYQRRRILAAAAVALYLFIPLGVPARLFLRYESGLTMLLSFSRLWLGAVFFLLLLFHLSRHLSIDGERLSRLRAALLIVFTAAALTTGIAGYRHHFFHRQQEMSLHVLPPASTLLETLPRSESGSYLSIAMEPEGYRVSALHGLSLIDTSAFKSTADQLSFTTAPDHSLFMEVADASGSRIVHTSNHSVIVEDAESPAVSTDGRQLAFLRERKGRGSLWLMSLSPAPAAPQALRLTQDDYDVRSVSFFHSGTLLFLAKHNGHIGLFTTTGDSQPSPFFQSNTEITGLAISPDEHHVAFTQLVNHRWQLAVLSIPSGRVTLLTSTDCNAYTPAWSTPSSIVYATDCGRGLGLTALASIDISSQ